MKVVYCYQQHTSLYLQYFIVKMQNGKVQNNTGSEDTIIPQQQSAWRQLIQEIVRPERADYNQEFFGPSQFVLNKIPYQRKDTQILHEGKKILLTTFDPQQKNMWMVLYLHGNSASRVEGLSVIRYLPPEYSLACFDFIGCGHNFEEDMISLGVREAQQVQTVVNFLELLGYRIILWGRSMGAATALKFGQAPIIVADSSFSSFKDLCKEIAKQKAPILVPNILINCLFPCVFSKLRNDILELAHFDVEELDIAENVKKITPEKLVIFLTGKQDKLIDKMHSQILFKSFGGERKILEFFRGTHNSKRPSEVMQKVMKHISDFVKEKYSNKQYEITHTNSKINIELN